MHRLLYLLILWSLVTGLTGCEKDLDVRYLSGETRMVINSKIDNLSPIKIYLTQSVSLAGTAKPQSITDAVVQLYENDSLLQALPYVYSDTAQTFGYYLYNNPGQPGKRYTIVVSHPQYGTATATDSVSMIPNILSHQLLYYGDSSNNYQSMYSIKLLDNGAINGYYRLSVIQWGKRFEVSTNGDTTFYDYGNVSNIRLYTPLPDTIREYNTDVLFSDKTFNGQTLQLDFSTQGVPLNETTEAYYMVILSDISPAHYNYVKTLATRNDFNTGNGNGQTYCNVQNGLGILMTQSMNQMFTKVK